MDTESDFLLELVGGGGGGANQDAIPGSTENRYCPFS
jgi:hypothetical protein